MEVTEKVKKQYQSDSVHKKLKILFPGINYSVSNANIDAESMELRESILEENSIEFVGCISSMFSIQLQEVYRDIKGQRIEVSICTDDTEDEPIPLFHGIVDSAVMQSNKKSKKVTAYDQLYTKGNTEVSGWYNSLSFPVTLRTLRDSLFEYLGIEQVPIELPNDEVSIDKKYDPKSLKALNVIKAVCQINGAFGIINRQDKFEYRILADLSATYAYPSTLLFPSSGLFPTNPQAVQEQAAALAAEMETESFGFYKKVDYEEYEVKPVDKLTIRQSENEAGVSYGSGTNNYIIQGNMFTLGKAAGELSEMAKKIYKNVRGIYYHPFESDNNGLPYIECGLDAVSYYMKDFLPPETSAYSTKNGGSSTMRNFYVFSRELTGIQALRDNYSANGEEYQTEFITDLQTQIDTIKVNVKEEIDNTIKDYDFSDKFNDFTYDKDYIDSQFQNMSQLKVESVTALPAAPDQYTIYLIQGEVSVT